MSLRGSHASSPNVARGRVASSSCGRSRPANNWPSCLKDERGHADLGFRFHRETDQENVEPYGWPDLIRRNEDFYRSLAALRTTLVRRLREIKKSHDLQAVPVAAPTAAAAQRPPPPHLHPRPHTAPC